MFVVGALISTFNSGYSFDPSATATNPYDQLRLITFIGGLLMILVGIRALRRGWPFASDKRAATAVLLIIWSVPLIPTLVVSVALVAHGLGHLVTMQVVVSIVAVFFGTVLGVVPARLAAVRAGRLHDKAHIV